MFIFSVTMILVNTEGEFFKSVCFRYYCKLRKLYKGLLESARVRTEAYKFENPKNQFSKLTRALYVPGYIVINIV